MSVSNIFVQPTSNLIPMEVEVWNNLAGGGAGNITGELTSGFIPIATGITTISDSIISGDGDGITITPENDGQCFTVENTFGQALLFVNTDSPGIALLATTAAYDVAPNINNSYSLGYPSYSWSHVYSNAFHALGNTLNRVQKLDSNLKIVNSSIIDDGTNVTVPNIIDSSGTVNAVLKYNSSKQIVSSNISDDGSIINLAINATAHNFSPTTTNTYDIGGSSNTWNRLYTKNLTDDSSDVFIKGVNSSSKFYINDNSSNTILAVNTTAGVVFIDANTGIQKNLAVQGANNANKFVVYDNSSNILFNINSTTPLITLGSNTNCSKNLLITGANDSSKFNIVDNSANVILNVNTTSGNTSVSKYSAGTTLSVIQGLNDAVTPSNNNSIIQMFTTRNSRSASLTLDDANNILTINKPFYPATTTTYGLGGSSNKWSTFYSTMITDNGSLCIVRSPNNATSVTGLAIGDPVGVFYLWAGSATANITNNANNNTMMQFDQSNGNILGRTHSPFANNTYDLGTSGTAWRNIYSNNLLNVISDRNSKIDITPENYGLEFVEKLKPVKYRMKERDAKYSEQPRNGDNPVTMVKTESIPGVRYHHGLVAQDVEAVLSDSNDFAGFVKDTDTGKYFLRYGEFIAPLIKAVQELSAKNKALEARIKTMENRLLIVSI